MAVKGVEIKVGQKWKTREGKEVEVIGNDGDWTYPWDLSNGFCVTNQGQVWQYEEDVDDLITLIQDEHGFTPWSGGECPVSYGVKIEYKMKNDPTKIFEGFPDGLRWEHFDLRGDIIAYRVVKQEDKPAKVDAEEEQTKEVVVETKTEHTEEPKYTIKEVNKLKNISFYTSEPIVGYQRRDSGYIRHQDWDKYGKAVEFSEFSIKEIIPASSNNSVANPEENTDLSFKVKTLELENQMLRMLLRQKGVEV